MQRDKMLQLHVKGSSTYYEFFLTSYYSQVQHTPILKKSILITPDTLHLLSEVGKIPITEKDDHFFLNKANL